MTKEQFINSSIEEKFKEWLLKLYLWGTVVFLTLILLDYHAVPEKWDMYLIYRLAISSILLTLYAVSKKLYGSSINLHIVLGHAGVFLSAVAIQMMVMDFGGHQSPYYVGLILLAVGVISFIPSKIRFHLVNSIFIYMIYLLPIVFFDDITDYRYFYIANFFMLSILSGSLYLRFISNISLKTEFGQKYDLENYRNMQDRMNPHFLYNAMHTIHALMYTDVKKADNALSVLSEMFHFLTDRSFEPLIAFEEEWSFVENYLNFQKIRFDDTLIFKLEKKGAFEDVKIPSLTIQPLIENSIKHGLRKKEGVGTVVVSALNTGGRITITIEDDGSGLINEKNETRTIKNILARLKFHFPGGRLSVSNMEKGGTRAVIEFSIKK